MAIGWHHSFESYSILVLDALSIPSQKGGFSVNALAEDNNNENEINKVSDVTT